MVTVLPTASTQSAAAWTYGTPSPSRPVQTRMMTSRSARSVMPTFAVMPRPSARARAYDTTAPVDRQYRQSATSSRSRPSPAYQSAIPPKTAASPTRSRVESSHAPQRLERSVIRAMVPSIRSENTKQVMTMVPQKNS